LKSTETRAGGARNVLRTAHFSNFGSLKSTETPVVCAIHINDVDFSNFGSLKSTETAARKPQALGCSKFQQFRLVEEH